MTKEGKIKLHFFFSLFNPSFFFFFLDFSLLMVFCFSVFLELNFLVGKDVKKKRKNKIFFLFFFFFCICPKNKRRFSVIFNSVYFGCCFSFFVFLFHSPPLPFFFSFLFTSNSSLILVLSCSIPSTNTCLDLFLFFCNL